MTIEIRVIREEGADVFAPLAICDHCGQPIERAEDGLYCWGFCLDDMTNTPVKFFHKNEATHPACNWANHEDQRRMEQQGYTWMWMPLGDFVTYLANNLHYKRQLSAKALLAA